MLVSFFFQYGLLFWLGLIVDSRRLLVYQKAESYNKVGVFWLFLATKSFSYLSFSSPSREDSSCNDSASAPALPDWTEPARPPLIKRVGRPPIPRLLANQMTLRWTLDELTHFFSMWFFIWLIQCRGLLVGRGLYTYGMDNNKKNMGSWWHIWWW